MSWAQHFNSKMIKCSRCPRLVQWREKIAKEKKREFKSWSYWGKPVPSFGNPEARLLIIGLAPAAHGGNRTGRVFTGDSSGKWLFRALHKAGLANQPTWESADDGLVLFDSYITTIIHCAPPDNKPTPEEVNCCSSYLDEELLCLNHVRVVLVLGKIAFDNYLKALRRIGVQLPSPLPKFAHNNVYEINNELPILLASYHPSRQNTNTGILTEVMFDAVFSRVKTLLSKRGSNSVPIK